MPLDELGHSVDDCGPAGLDAVVVTIARLRPIVGRGLQVAEPQLEISAGRLPLALDDEHIVVAALKTRRCGRLLGNASRRR